MGFQSWVSQTFSNLSTPKQEGDGSYFFVVGSQNDSFGEIDYLKSYESIPELNAIINMKARTSSNMKIKAINKNGDEVNTPETDRVKNLIANPNWFQDGNEFLIQTKTLREIFGNEYIFLQIPFGFSDKSRVKQLFTLPSNIIKCEYKSSTPFFMNDSKAGIQYSYKEDQGQYKSLDINQIIHLNDNRVSLKSASDSNLLKGESKMKPLSVAINNIRMAYESRGVILKYRGADGAWVNKSKDAVGQTMPLDDTEKNELQRSFSKYGTLKGQNQTIITNQDLAWIQAAVKDPSKLGLFEEIEKDFNKMLDSYGVPAEIFVRTTGSTYENQRQAEKGLYVRTTIPEANEWLGAVTSELRQDDSITYIADYSHLPIFQEDLKERSDSVNSMITALSKMLSDKQITQDEYREEIAKYGMGDGKAIPQKQDSNQQEIETQKAQAQLRGSVGGVQGILAIQTAVSQGTATRDAALSTLTIVYGFTNEQATQILGNPEPAQNQNF